MNQRYNGFLLTHKALRAMLYDTAIHLQQYDNPSGKKSDDLIEKLEAVMLAFDKHSELEDEYILPLIEQKAPQLFAAFETEHQKDRTLTRQLYHLIGEYKSNPPDVEILGFIFYRFNDFLAFNIAHMNKEETVLNEELWHHYSDEQLHAVHQEIIRTRTPEERETSLFWMFKGCSASELTGLLESARQNMPPEAFQAFFEHVKNNTESHKWRLIEPSFSDQLHFQPTKLN